MHYTNHQTTPVFSSDCHPLMLTHPAKARKLMQKGRALPQFSNSHAATFSLAVSKSIPFSPGSIPTRT